MSAINRRRRTVSRETGSFWLSFSDMMSVLVLVFSVAYFLGHIVLIATGQEQKILHATIAGAVINAAVNFLLIPRPCSAWKPAKRN